ncbi:MAG: hypothetical protein II477_02215 [Lachnospiraceae bacterium]|nr:hypothetical protein [Lachnospiraceae bacterium]
MKLGFTATWKHLKSRQEGSIGDLLSVLLCILGMTTVMIAFLSCVKLVNQKTMVGQLARTYVLRMETVGYLTPEDEAALRNDLAELEILEVSLEGTTRTPVGYGAQITLRISGKIGGEHAFEEKRVSTAKH